MKKILAERLNLQASEADTQGKTSLAEILTNVIVKNSTDIRNNDDKYIYDKKDFKKDVYNDMWNVIIRTADFYDITDIDSEKMNEVVNKLANSLIHELVKQSHVDVTCGAHESSLPGEMKFNTEIEVSE